MPHTRGRALLLQRREQYETQAAMAERIGCSRQLLCKWLKGERTPGRQWARRLRDQLGIDLAAWDEPASK